VYVINVINVAPIISNSFPNISTHFIRVYMDTHYDINFGAIVPQTTILLIFLKTEAEYENTSSFLLIVTRMSGYFQVDADGYFTFHLYASNISAKLTINSRVCVMIFFQQKQVI
jgi:hypothetical protein